MVTGFVSERTKVESYPPSNPGWLDAGAAVWVGTANSVLPPGRAGTGPENL
jgi:hypothetical protein